MRYFYYVTQNIDKYWARIGEFEDKAELISSENGVIMFIDELSYTEFRKLKSNIDK